MHSECFFAPPPLALVPCTLYTPSTTCVAHDSYMCWAAISQSSTIYIIFSIYILQIILPEGMPSRWGHSLTATSLTPGLTEVTLFGGCTKFDPQLSGDKLPMIAETAVLTLGEGRQ